MTVKVQFYDPKAGHHSSSTNKITLDETDYRIIARLNEPAESIVTLADPTGRVFRSFKERDGLDLAGAVADDGGVETDETAESQEDTADDMTLLPANPVDDDAYYFGFDSDAVTGFTLNVTTAGSSGIFPWTGVWEYSTGGDTWEKGPTGAFGFDDMTAFFRVAGSNPVSWSLLSGWVTDTVGGVAGKYWVRFRVNMLGLQDYVQPKGGQAWVSSIYIGPARITIDNGGTIYDGRIINVSFDQGSNTVILHCQDWMSQLDDTIITKEMREDLDGNGLREAEAHSEPDGAFVDVAENDAGTFYFYDDGEYEDVGGMAWANDQFNGMKLVLAASMEGTKTWRFFPYQGTETDADTYTDTRENLWIDDLGNDRGSADNDFTLDYDFRVYLGHNTPSDLYVHDSIKGGRVGVVYQVGGGSGNHSHILVEDKGNPGTYFDKTHLTENDQFNRVVVEINADEIGHIIDANGIATVRFDVDRLGGTASMFLRYLYLEVDVDTSGYDDTISIVDTINPNKLEVGTDLTAAATRIWEKINYCIVRAAYKHIDSDETPGDLITDGSTGSGPDPLVVITAAGTVEHTSSFSTRRYENSTRFKIIKDLAEIDRVAFFMEIGTTVFTWKSTFNDGAPTAMTDASVLKWSGEHSFFDVRNGFILYGPEQNDSLLRVDTADISPDPGVDSKEKYGVTRSRTVNNRGVNNQYELTELGTALVERDEDALLFLRCEIAGLSALRLGDEVSITSSYMGLTAEVYVITEWEFGWGENITRLRFHPRLSTKGFVKHRIFSDAIRRLGQDTQKLEDNVTYDTAASSH